MQGTCTVTCGIGNQERNVFCVSRADGSRINEGFCNINERPPVFETCILFNCPGNYSLHNNYISNTVFPVMKSTFPAVHLHIYMQDVVISSPLTVEYLDY